MVPPLENLSSQNFDQVMQGFEREMETTTSEEVVTSGLFRDNEGDNEGDDAW